MTCQLAMPTGNELAAMTDSELNQGSLLAQFLWQEKGRLGEPIAEYQQIYDAYAIEQNKRLKHLKKQLK